MRRSRIVKAYFQRFWKKLDVLQPQPQNQQAVRSWLTGNPAVLGSESSYPQVAESIQRVRITLR
jgi:hypothetical protein